jgi:transposase
MRPKRPEGDVSDDLFRARLSNQLDPGHPLVRLAGLIEWASFDAEFGSLYHEALGRPGKPTRLMVGLTYLLDLPRILADQSNDLSPAIRRLLADLFEDLHRLEERIAEVTREIEPLVSPDETARRLMTVPGIGPLGSSALIAAVRQGRQFKKARDLSARLGLVPRQYSTGGKPTSLGSTNDATAMCGGS